jgi:hypothetical protein
MRFARLLICACAFFSARADGAELAAVDFNRDVAPILAKRCLECHNDRDRAGALVLTGRESFLAGGDSGPPIEAASPADSLLLARVEAGEMPPERKGEPQPLPEGEVAILRAWIAAGAEWPEGRTIDLYESTSDVRAGRDWWSLKPVERSTVPAAAGDFRMDNPIDAFLWQRLNRDEMEMAPPADRQALIRRLYFDLVGLPPTAEEIDAFVGDPSPQAYERLVDRLLASPHFGERWARHWLDVVRYADTCGYERDQEKPHAWRYRDWVAQAFNSDKPYNDFLVEQLAGDELAERSEAAIIATGLLRLGTWNDEPNDDQEYKYERLEDLVHVVGSAFLGMTIKCARCHDHKFDPIPQVDYYRLAAAFWPGPIEPRQRELLGGPTKEELGFDVLGWTDVRSEPPPFHLLKKGDPRHPGDEVAFAPLSFTALGDAYAEVGPLPLSASTGRRKKLAQWIADPNNPLTARVIVNRLWMHHFGHGLVRSANNFGFTGDQPTYPELLDWLAAELVSPERRDRAWSLKRLHRLILLSQAYRQSSIHPRDAAYSEKDFDNRLVWRANLRRREAESLRDAMLFASGELDERIGGPGFRPTLSPDALEGLSRKAAAWQPSPENEQRRRSLYMFSQRSLIAPFLTTFDFCDTTQPCEARQTSTVAPQALTLLNNPFVHARSEALARRVLGISAGEARAQIETAWRLALGRSPTEEEVTAANEHLTSQRERFSAEGREAPQLLALASLCHVLLNSNEFAYVD